MKPWKQLQQYENVLLAVIVKKKINKIMKQILIIS